MAEGRASTSSRPLARSLDPLAGESAGGYLLRLACRLRLSPIGLARLTGCTKHPTTTQLGRRLLLDLDIQGFAHTTRLSSDEAAALTLVPWADRYPPVARSLAAGARRPPRENWLLNDIPRYCPQCLAGDRSPVQQDYGGPWKTIWHLPVVFACPDHEVLLQHGCPQGHPLGRAADQLITQAADGTLHPAQCRHPDPDQPASQGRKGRSCGARLDQPEGPGPPRPSTSVLKIQRRLLNLLGPGHPAEEAAARFTDLRVVTALLCTTWPSGQDMIDPGARSAVDEHVRALSAGSRQAFDRPPRKPAAAAALLTAASALLDAPDLGEVLARRTRATREGRPSRAPWTQVFDRHESSCSENLRQAAAPVTRAYRRTGFRGTKAPVRAGGYRPEHIPAGTLSCRVQRVTCLDICRAGVPGDRWSQESRAVRKGRAGRRARPAADRPPGAHIVYRRFRAARLPSSASPVQRTRPASICSCGSMRPQASWTNVTESVLSSTSGRSM